MEIKSILSEILLEEAEKVASEEAKQAIFSGIMDELGLSGKSPNQGSGAESTHTVSQAAGSTGATGVVSASVIATVAAVSLAIIGLTVGMRTLSANQPGDNQMIVSQPNHINIIIEASEEALPESSVGQSASEDSSHEEEPGPLPMAIVPRDGRSGEISQESSAPSSVSESSQRSNGERDSWMGSPSSSSPESPPIVPDIGSSESSDESIDREDSSSSDQSESGSTSEYEHEGMPYLTIERWQLYYEVGACLTVESILQDFGVQAYDCYGQPTGFSAYVQDDRVISTCKPGFYEIVFTAQCEHGYETQLWAEIHIVETEGGESCSEVTEQSDSSPLESSEPVDGSSSSRITST